MRYTRVLLTEYFASSEYTAVHRIVREEATGGEVERLRKRSRPSVTLGSHASAARRSCLTANILFQWDSTGCSCTKFYESYRSAKKNHHRRRRWRSIWRQYWNCQEEPFSWRGILATHLGVNGLDVITVNLYIPDVFAGNDVDIYIGNQCFRWFNRNLISNGSLFFFFRA